MQQAINICGHLLFRSLQIIVLVVDDAADVIKQLSLYQPQRYNESPNIQLCVFL